MRGAGRLRDRVWVLTWSKTKNADMEVVESYTAGAEVPCELRFLKGTERIQAQREGNEVDLEVRFRFEEGLVTAKDRLEYRDASPYEVYDIEAIYPDRKRHELICQCKLRT